MPVTRTGTACTSCTTQPGVREFFGLCARCRATSTIRDQIMMKRWCRVCGETLRYPDPPHSQASQESINRLAVGRARAMMCPKPECEGMTLVDKGMKTVLPL